MQDQNRISTKKWQSLQKKKNLTPKSTSSPRLDAQNVEQNHNRWPPETRNKTEHGISRRLFI